MLQQLYPKKVTKLLEDNTGDAGENLHDLTVGTAFLTKEDSQERRDVIKKIHKYTYVKINNFHTKRNHKENFKNNPEWKIFATHATKKVEILVQRTPKNQ